MAEGHADDNFPTFTGVKENIRIEVKILRDTALGTSVHRSSSLTASFQENGKEISFIKVDLAANGYATTGTRLNSSKPVSLMCYERSW